MRAGLARLGPRLALQVRFGRVRLRWPDVVALFIFRCLSVRAEVPEPFPHWAMNPPPVEEAYPAFAQNLPCNFTIAGLINASIDRVWAVMRQQPKLIHSMTWSKQVFNSTGSFGEWQISVQWHTAARWHRWTRTDVRKYVRVSDDDRQVSFFLSEGFGLWMPRLAFRETLALDPDTNSTALIVEVWYELDDKYIGWPTDNLKNLTWERWYGWYFGTCGYAEEVRDFALGLVNFTGKEVGLGLYPNPTVPAAICEGRLEKHPEIPVYQAAGFGMPAGGGEPAVPPIQAKAKEEL